MYKSIRETHEPKHIPTDAAEELEMETTVEPPESDHPKYLVVANGRWSLTKIEPQEVSLRRKLDTSYFREDNLLHAISKLQYVRSMLLRFLPQEIRILDRWSLTRG